MMKMASKLTLEAHYNQGLVMWSGGVGRGKTWCAEWMVDELNAQYDPQNPASFRLKHYEVAPNKQRGGREDKAALRRLYEAIVGPMDEGVYRRFTLEAIAEMVVHGLERTCCQILFVDEAGRLSLEALDALVLVINTAEIKGWPFTIVVVGMDDLPIKIKLNPRIYSRVCQKICFEPYTLNETWDLLAALDPYFAKLRREDREAEEQVKLIHELCGGNARDITYLVSRFAGMVRDHPDIEPMVAIRGAHQQPSRAEQRILEDMGFTAKSRHRRKKASLKDKKVGRKGKGKGAEDGRGN